MQTQVVMRCQAHAKATMHWTNAQKEAIGSLKPCHITRMHALDLLVRVSRRERWVGNIALDPWDAIYVGLSYLFFN